MVTKRATRKSSLAIKETIPEEMAAVPDLLRSCTNSLNGSLHSLSIDSMSDSLEPEDPVTIPMTLADRVAEEVSNNEELPSVLYKILLLFASLNVATGAQL